ncbi:MAG: hypothetical protein LC660_12245 [Desulfobacteraceae bacterium]|nr:hypothetical protein [Desulfobacteraceae bacterium]
MMITDQTEHSKIDQATGDLLKQDCLLCGGKLHGIKKIYIGVDDLAELGVEADEPWPAYSPLCENCQGADYKTIIKALKMGETHHEAIKTRSGC